jgi:hypothetical protein
MAGLCRARCSTLMPPRWRWRESRNDKSASTSAGNQKTIGEKLGGVRHASEKQFRSNLTGAWLEVRSASRPSIYETAWAVRVSMKFATAQLNQIGRQRD